MQECGRGKIVTRSLISMEISALRLELKVKGREMRLNPIKKAS